MKYIECQVLCYSDDEAMQLADMGVEIEGDAEYRQGFIVIDDLSSIIPRYDGSLIVSTKHAEFQVEESYESFTSRIKSILNA